MAKNKKKQKKGLKGHVSNGAASVLESMVNLVAPEKTHEAPGWEPMDSNDWNRELDSWRELLRVEGFAESTIRNKMAAAQGFLIARGHITAE